MRNSVVAAMLLAIVATSLYLPVHHGTQLESPLTSAQAAELGGPLGNPPNGLTPGWRAAFSRGDRAYTRDSTRYVWLWNRAPVRFLGARDGWPGQWIGWYLRWALLLTEQGLILLVGGGLLPFVVRRERRRRAAATT